MEEKRKERKERRKVYFRKMRNFKVKTKLIISFTLAIALSIAVGVVGIIGMSQINNRAEYMYRDITEPMPYLARIQETLQNARVQVREMVLAAKNDNMDEVEVHMSDILRLVDLQEVQLNTYADSLVVGGSREVLFSQARDLYENRLIATVLAIYEACKIQDFDEINLRMEDCRIISEQIMSNYDEMLDITVSYSEDAFSDATSTVTRMLIIIFVVLGFSIVSALMLAMYISNLISKPISATAGFFRQASSTGKLVCTPEVDAIFNKYKHNQDEIGQLIKDCNAYIDSVILTSDKLKSIAAGDLTIKVEALSDEDTIGISLKHVVDHLNGMFGNINSASTQVTSGANQISAGANLLADGASQQAATLQEISASISDIANKTQSNAERTANASDLANEIMQNAEKSSIQMEQMIKAVNEINSANQNISKVIKAIDDIAFQTNILALNAAVEAARAGSAGKGFAVVAEEVRNLAAKSAESAKDTSTLIANSMEKAQLGTQIAGETAESLTEIVSGIIQSNEIISEIAKSSDEQNTAINQINTAVSEVTQVVQQNSATAEESAAASVQMSGQADLLESLIDEFKLLKEK